MTVSLVTGANSGIGRAVALRLAADGHEVHGGMRDLGRGTKLAAMADEAGVVVHPVQLDVTDDASVARAVDAVLASAGRIDVLVNNAGIGWNATTEDVDIDAAKLAFETNYWGAIRCLQAVLPGMRERAEGHIVNVSSIAGRIAAIGQVVYSGSKWALEALSENLAQEVAPFGIRVSVIEPGITRTAILPKNPDYPTPTAYEPQYERMLEFYAAGIMAEVQPDVVADVVAEALTADEPRLRWPCAWGGAELIAGRDAMTDEEWVELGALAVDPPAYRARFAEAFGLDVDVDLG